MDWITLTIEVVGIVILLAWIVVPIREFREILRIIHRRNGRPHGPAGSAGESSDEGGRTR